MLERLCFLSTPSNESGKETRSPITYFSPKCNCSFIGNRLLVPKFMNPLWTHVSWKWILPRAIGFIRRARLEGETGVSLLL
ncbi:hypothetical protein VULLAG_LOCUS4619 [Vulpes lagopus]